MIETVSLGIAAGAAVVSFALGNVTTYLLTKYKNPDLDGDGTVEKEELMVIYNDAMSAFVAYKDAIDDIIEDVDISPEETVAALKNITKLFK